MSDDLISSLRMPIGDWTDREGYDDRILAADRIEALEAQLVVAREALERLLPFVLNDYLECHGDKCRHPTCASCFGEEYAAQQSDKADLALFEARNALAQLGELK